MKRHIFKFPGAILCAAVITLASCSEKINNNKGSGGNGGGGGNSSSVISGIWVAKSNDKVSIEVTGEHSEGSVARYVSFDESRMSKLQEAVGIGGEIYRIGVRQKSSTQEGDFNDSGDVSMGWACEMRLRHVGTGELSWNVARGIYFYAEVSTGFEELRMIGDEWSERWVRPEGHQKRNWGDFTGEE
jgi:hypothetical protein